MKTISHPFRSVIRIYLMASRVIRSPSFQKLKREFGESRRDGHGLMRHLRKKLGAWLSCVAAPDFLLARYSLSPLKRKGGPAVERLGWFRREIAELSETQ
jgi:hypothetical protein